MDEHLEHNLLYREILILSARLAALDTGMEPVLTAEELAKLDLADLRRIKKDLRDLVRSLGGANA